MPVQRRSGRVQWIAPWEIARGAEDDPVVSFAWPRPDFDAASHEFLIGLLATCVAPADEDEWEAWWQTPPSPEDLRTRFDSVAEAFAVDGPGPRFMQDLDPLAEAEETPIDALLMDAPGEKTRKDNADLFVKRRPGIVLSREAAAMALFILQLYAPAGGKGHRTSIRGGGPLTTLIVAGETLWGRLWPNVETRERIEARRLGVLDERRGLFPWTGPTRISDATRGGRPTTPAGVDPLHVYWGMPRRIRLVFEPAGERRCALTGREGPVVVRAFRTQNYGTHYSEGFVHPLSPHYRIKPGEALLPVHPQPSGLGYRHWLGLVVASRDGLREPAAAVRDANTGPRARTLQQPRLVAFGYDMDKMKARNFLVAEMPLGGPVSDVLALDVERLIRAADVVARRLVRAVKEALFERPADAAGDYGFLADRFWRDTEAPFYAALDLARARLAATPDAPDATRPVREGWAKMLEAAALALFEEHAPLDTLGRTGVERIVRARFSLVSALCGIGKAGEELFQALDLAAPSTGRNRGKAGGRGINGNDNTREAAP